MDIYKVLKYNKQPDFIAHDKKIPGTNWREQEWYTKDIAVPDWWNDKCHRLKEVSPSNYVKFCLLCNKNLFESGCKHNL